MFADPLVGFAERRLVTGVGKFGPSVEGGADCYPSEFGHEACFLGAHLALKSVSVNLARLGQAALGDPVPSTVGGNSGYPQLDIGSPWISSQSSSSGG